MRSGLVCGTDQREVQPRLQCIPALPLTVLTLLSPLVPSSCSKRKQGKQAVESTFGAVACVAGQPAMPAVRERPLATRTKAPALRQRHNFCMAAAAQPPTPTFHPSAAPYPPDSRRYRRPGRPVVQKECGGCGKCGVGKALPQTIL